MSREQDNEEDTRYYPQLELGGERRDINREKEWDVTREQRENLERDIKKQQERDEGK